MKAAPKAALRAARPTGGGSSSLLGGSSASALAAARLARPIGSARIVKGTRLGLSASALRRAKRKARAGAAVGGALGSLGGLAAAVENAAAARPPPPPPNFSRGRVRMAVAAAETARLGGVLAHPSYVVDPIAAVGAHLAATAPPVPAGMERGGAGKGGSGGSGGATAVDPERLRQQRIRRRREAKQKARSAADKREAMQL